MKPLIISGMFLNSGVLVPQFSETPLLGSLAQETEDLQCVVVRGTFLEAVVFYAIVGV